MSSPHELAYDLTPSCPGCGTDLGWGEHWACVEPAHKPWRVA